MVASRLALLAALSMLALAPSQAGAQVPASVVETAPVISALGETSKHVCRLDASVGGTALPQAACTRNYAPLVFSRKDRIKVTTPRAATSVSLGSTTERAACSSRKTGVWRCPARKVGRSARTGVVAIRYSHGRARWAFDTQVTRVE